MAEGFKINKAYAEKYNTWRQKEELQKLKDRYGGEDDSEESSSSESEDEDAEALTDQLERDWLRTLSALKSKDPRIYQTDVKFYHDDEKDTESIDAEKGKKSKDKPMYLKDYERKVLLERGGVISDEDRSGSDEPSTSYNSQLGYHQEQEQLRKSIVAAAAGSDSDDSDDEGLFRRREKSADEKQREDTDYVEWLKGQKDTLDKGTEVGVELEPLKNYWQNKNLDEGEKFLKNYILNKQYIENDEGMPTYEEIVNDEDEDFSDEEELLVKQDSFERKYNFRFEEPDATEIKTFPRNLEETVRRKDTKRTEKRKEVEERKKKEKEKKKEGLKQLKKLKRQEILDKIEKLKQITGNKTLGIDEKELDEDFDPNKHDQLMQQCFDDQYYGDGEGEDIKPVFEMSDEEMDNWDKWTGEGDDYGGNEGYDEGSWNENPSAEDPDFVMDADYDPVADMERKKNKKEKKKKNKLAQVLNTKKPVFDPNEKTFEEYFDEYYKLDYEDIIDDTPCRFKYRKVTPNAYGLTVDEILKCRDKELNAWASVKKMSQYRSGEEEERDIQAYTAKGKNMKKKQNVLTSLFESEEKDEVGEKNMDKPEAQKKSKSRKKREKRKAKKQQMAAGKDRQNSDKVSKPENSEHKNEAGKRKSVDTKTKGERENETDSDRDQITEDIVDKLEAEHNESKHSKKRKAEEIVDETDVNNEISKETETKSRKKKKKLSSEEDEERSVCKNDKELESNEHNVGITDVKFEKSDQSVDTKDKDGKRKKKNKKKKKNKEGQKLKMSEERLKAYGINPKKYKYMKKEELFQIKPRKNTKQPS